MKMKKIISLLFIICTILVVAGCGSSKSKFEGTWYGLSNLTAYKVEITPNGNDYLIKTYNARYDLEKNELNHVIVKWTGFYPVRQDIGKLNDENTLVIDQKYKKKVWTMNKNNEIEGPFPDLAVQNKLMNSKTFTETDVKTAVQNAERKFHKGFKTDVTFIE